MKLTDLNLLVNTLNTKLTQHNSLYRLRMNNNMDVSLVDKDGDSVDDDNLTVIVPNDLVDYVDDIISNEQSNM